jgi:DNA repair exonuclease SbcCD ATPase subunit
MELIVNHFRCYRNQSFYFPPGVILIDGPSGKGKTTLLLAIKYALFGNVKSVTTFGEKKTSVELRTNGISITRTTIPSRLVVKTEEKDYEDAAAQAFLHRMFGPPDQFEITSYMMQKGSETFFSMSGAQKLYLLEQLSLLGDQDIQLMKDSIQRDSKEKKKQAEKLEHQVELLRTQVGEEPVFEKKPGFSSVSDVYQVVGFLQASQKNWEKERVRCDQLLFEYTSALMKQQEQRVQYEQVQSNIRFIKEEYKRVQDKLSSMVNPEHKRQLYQSYRMAHENWLQYKQRSIMVQEEHRLFHQWFSMEQSAYERIEKEWNSCQIDETLFQTYTLYQIEQEKWDKYQHHLQTTNELSSQFKEWIEQQQKEYNTFLRDWKEVTIDPSILQHYEEEVTQHELALVYEKEEKEVHTQKDQFQQWLQVQVERYQHWKEEFDRLDIDTTLQKQYELYCINQEQYDHYQQHNKVLSQYQDQFDSWLADAERTYQRIQTQRTSLFISPLELEQLEKRIKNHEQWERYQQCKKQTEEKTTWFHNMMESAIQQYERELEELENQRSISIVDKEEIMLKQQSAQKGIALWKRINELKKKRPEQEVDLQLDTLKKNREIMEKFFTNLEARKNTFPCPSCKTSLIIQSQKIQPGNLAPLSEADLKKEEEYKVKLPKVIEKYDKNYREWISREEDKKEIESLVREVESSEEEYKSIIHECMIGLQEEYAREQSQLQLDQMLQLKKQQHPKVLYQTQEKEIEMLQYELSCMDKGEESSIPLATLNQSLQEMKYNEQRYRELECVHPLDTDDYRSKKMILDDFITKRDTMEKGDQCPILMDEVKATLREMKQKIEKRATMNRMEEPMNTEEYKKRLQRVEKSEEKLIQMKKGLLSAMNIDVVKQHIWDMKSKEERKSRMKEIQKPEDTEDYKRREQHIEETIQKGNEMEHGSPSPVPIKEVQQQLFEMKTCHMRQSLIQRIPLPEASKEYDTRNKKLSQLEYELSIMDKGEESPIPMEEINRQLEEWNVQAMEEKHYQQRLATLAVEIEEKQKDNNVTLDQTDYQTLLEETKKQHQWITERMELPCAQIKMYTEYAESMKRYMKYRTMICEIHEKNRLCAIYYTQLEQLESLHQHMIQAEGICLEQFLRRVNQKINNYMEHFFPDASLQMELCTEKETKSGKIKNEICVLLTQNHHQTELKHLSGGEYDRCSLAFMLAINELSHSPFLFLDESISSLDLSLSEDVLEIIKEKQTELKKTVLLISHQANTGFFDHVIRI